VLNIDLAGTPYNKAKKAANTLRELLEARFVDLNAKYGKITLPTCYLSRAVAFYNKLQSDNKPNVSDLCTDLYQECMSLINYFMVFPNVLCMLFQNPNVVLKLKKSLAEFPELCKLDHIPTCAELNKATYLCQVERELFRWFPFVALVAGQSKKEFNLAGYRVPKGVPVWGSLWSINMDPDVYKNPEKFDPDRFSPVRQEDQHAKCPLYAFATFGGGTITTTHKCLGEPVNQQVTRAWLIRCVLFYNFRDFHGQNFELDFHSAAPLPKDGVKVSCATRGRLNEAPSYQEYPN